MFYLLFFFWRSHSRTFPCAERFFFFLRQLFFLLFSFFYNFPIFPFSWTGRQILKIPKLVIAKKTLKKIHKNGLMSLALSPTMV
ncbi:hypothetical protein DM01DRAFT_196188 [Hesseltinella vesiculosa]|uniref:Uncharacterized protein n=1 Tax=Hesseltinella vesiculosa TaxID=101127 RepID=A0A1X2GFD7_9FUNG|nr:hypothetical protein DM01DRAFT_196188 [Hesseltinella vesiculosa]